MQDKLVLPKLAVYATPDNLEKYLTSQTEVAHSAQSVIFFV